MSRADKTLEKLLSGQQDENIPFADLCHLITKLGYVMRQKGSHHFFSKAGSTAINVQPNGSKAKATKSGKSALSSPRTHENLLA